MTSDPTFYRHPVDTCEDCGRSGRFVTTGPCGYEVDVNDVDPEDESMWHTVCEDCERDHCDDI